MGCIFFHDENGVWLLLPVPGKANYPYNTMQSVVWVKYLQKTKITVTLKDGSNVKGSVTGYIGRNSADEVFIY